MKNKNSFPFSEQRLLSVDDFCSYASIGRNTALDFMHTHSAMCIRFGRRLLIDRKKFDDWCSSYGAVPNPRTKRRG